MKKILLQWDLPGVTAAQYDNTWKDVRAAGHTQPQGLIYHVGAQTDTGWAVVDVWESQEAFDTFSAILGPIMAKHGLPDVQPRVSLVHYDLAGKVKAPAAVL